MVRDGIALPMRGGCIREHQGLGDFLPQPIEQDLTGVRTTSEVASA
jgi:hypothetical protein